MRKWCIVSPIILVIAWSILTYGSVVNNVILPYPHKVIAEFWRYSITGEAVTDILSTLKRLFCGLTLGVILGVCAGILLGYFVKLYRSLEFVIDFFRSIPATALFPIFMLIFGLGDISRIIPVVYGSGFIMLINTAYGVKNSEKTRIMAAETMGASKLDILTKVVLPGALPYIAAGLRITVSIALAITIVSEMFMGVNSGLGYRIMESKVMYDIPNVFVALIITGLLGYVLNKLFLFIEVRMVHWGGK